MWVSLLILRGLQALAKTFERTIISKNYLDVSYFEKSRRKYQNLSKSSLVY